ncbi:hypothetical protein SNE40_007208 [Patella caerulea]|uniref:Uncharacterized protein n=1 Tax=Patella caerulea TaxID=87958 RepID=A0AAN8JZ85_PATCE
MLTTWLSDNNTTEWTVGLKFVQFQKNSSYHSGIKRTPFAALLGSDAKVGLTTSRLPAEIISRLQTEEDLLNIISPAPTTEPDTEPAPTPTTEPAPTQDVIETRQEEIQTQRKRAAESQLQQAEKMVKRSKVVL